MYNENLQTLSSQNGLSLDEVARCLGASIYDLGTLCKHPDIRMWSKVKPIESDEVFKVSDEARTAALYGLEAPGYKTSYMDVKTLVWTYKRPTGLFRLSDFDGYCHKASNPPFLAGSFSLNTFWGGGVTIGTNPNIGVAVESVVQYDDIPNWHLGVVFTSGSKTYFKVFANGHPALTSDDTEILVNQGQAWSYYFVLVNNEQTTAELPSTPITTMPVGFKYLPALCDEASQVQGTLTVVKSSGISMSVVSAVSTNSVTASTSWPATSTVPIGPPSSPNPDGSYNDRFMGVTPNYTMALKLSVKSTDGNQHTVRKGYLKVRLSSNFVGASPEFAVKDLLNSSASAIDSFVVPSSGSVTVIVTLPTNLYRMNASGTVVQSVTTGQKIFPSISLTYNPDNANAPGNVMSSVTIRVQN